MHTRLENIGVIVAALFAAGGVGWWMVHFAGQKEFVSVMAAKKNLVAPLTISANDLAVINVPRESLPLTALIDAKEIIGKVLTRSVSAREILTTQDLVYDRDPNSASALVPQGKTGFVLPSSWLAAPFPKVKKNDFITVYVAFPPTRAVSAGGGVVLSFARVLAVSADKDGNPGSLLLALDDNAVGRISQAHAGSYQLTAAVESAEPAEATSTFR